MVHTSHTTQTKQTPHTYKLLAGKVARRCPVTGRPYRLAPVQRRAEARRPTT